MSFLYDAETEVEPAGDGRFTTHLTSAWNIGDNPNGGYLISPVLRSMAASCGHPQPLTVTVHYLRPGTGDAPAEIDINVIREGRSLSTLRGSLVQAGRERLEVLAAFCDHSVGTDDLATLTEPVVELPLPDECLLRSGLEQGVNLPILERVEVMIPPEQVTAGTMEEARISGWIRHIDGRPVDAASLVLFADAFPPPIFGLLGVVGWVPTIELTVQVRREPAPGWIRAEFTCEDLQGGRMIENGRLWDSEGALVAQSRQVSMLLPRD